ncbi:MAG: DNA mismatch repair endonuclease MutL [Patescibacteria group bacterium]|jgi:DNA mismatch repair protein MutL
MGKIRALPAEVVSKIAAGEVIERPAYALKELLENAIDAGASDIRIEIEDSGLKKISVTDNGEGMDRQDLEVCFLPHTTSKLPSDNLSTISTMGFRGEALSSIAAISELKIISRQKNKTLGHCIETNKGKITSTSPTGAPAGTVVLVKNLFANVPARKKFLRNPRTEFRHLLEIFAQSALAYPKIRFELIHNDKQIFDLSQNQEILPRIKLLLGPSVYENLIPLNFEDSYLKISGFLCKPQITTTINSRQYIFVNKRRVFDSLISSAVKEGFSGLIEPTSHPVFVLFIETPKETIDVNVHPRKEQIKFLDQQHIFEIVQKAVRQTLSENNLTFYNLSWLGSSQDKTGKTNSFLGQLLKDEVLPAQDKDIGTIDLSKEVIQIHNLYLLCQTKGGILILDQHAAHERVLFEEFKLAFQRHKQGNQTYELPKAMLLDLSPSDTQALLENINFFEEIGFRLEQFGDTTFKIEAVPVIFKDWDCNTFIKETLEEILQNGKPKDVDRHSQKMLAYLACRSAIKAGDKLTKKEVKELIKKLAPLDLAYTCPHGRPLKVEIPLAQLDKLFKR